MSYKRVIPCIFIHEGKAVKWFDNSEVLSDDVVELAINNPKEIKKKINRKL